MLLAIQKTEAAHSKALRTMRVMTSFGRSMISERGSVPMQTREMMGLSMNTDHHMGTALDGFTNNHSRRHTHMLRSVLTYTPLRCSSI
jgi:hypothetical protein